MREIFVRLQPLQRHDVTLRAYGDEVSVQIGGGRYVWPLTGADATPDKLRAAADIAGEVATAFWKMHGILHETANRQEQPAPAPPPPPAAPPAAAAAPAAPVPATPPPDPLTDTTVDQFAANVGHDGEEDEAPSEEEGPA